jgi:hypothetical protein
MDWIRRGHGEDGSLPMVLLAAIIMAGVVPAIHFSLRCVY